MSQRPDLRQPDFADLSTRIYRLCLALLGDEEHAQDAAQESLSRAWSVRHRKREKVSWWVWAGGFAVRVCREVRRSRAKRAAHRFETAATWLDEAAPSSLAHEEEAISPSSATLRDAIVALPARQREMVVLRFLLSLSTRKTAELLGCPEGTVKSNLHKALANLQATLEASGWTHELRGV